MSRKHLTDWKLAASGISVQAGPIRIRMEAGGTLKERKQIARLISAVPEMFEALKQIGSRAEDYLVADDWAALEAALLKAVGGT